MADFGSSKRIEEASNKQPDFDIDPQIFDGPSKQSYPSDVYSVGVLFWEISSGKQPFYVEGESYDGSLAVQILQGHRESIIPGTPADYAKLYTGKYRTFEFHLLLS